MTATVYYRKLTGEQDTIERDEATVKEWSVIAYDNPDQSGVEAKVEIPSHHVERVEYE